MGEREKKHTAYHLAHFRASSEVLVRQPHPQENRIQTRKAWPGIVSGGFSFHRSIKKKRMRWIELATATPNLFQVRT